MLPKGGLKSVVQQRFAELIFAPNEAHVNAAGHDGQALSSSLSDGDDSKRKIAKIQMWRKCGRKWAQVIQRFGYGILLLLPTSLSDEE